jgi:hypothetical protein
VAATPVHAARRDADPIDAGDGRNVALERALKV